MTRDDQTKLFLKGWDELEYILEFSELDFDSKEVVRMVVRSESTKILIEHPVDEKTFIEIVRSIYNFVSTKDVIQKIWSDHTTPMVINWKANKLPFVLKTIDEYLWEFYHETRKQRNLRLNDQMKRLIPEAKKFQEELVKENLRKKYHSFIQQLMGGLIKCNYFITNDDFRCVFSYGNSIFLKTDPEKEIKETLMLSTERRKFTIPSLRYV